jgi:hypothetical protein
MGRSTVLISLVLHVHFPCPVQILVDYDNIPPLVSRNGPRFVADLLQARLIATFPQFALGNVRLDFRFYGGGIYAIHNPAVLPN